jgi:hypothetical protein
VHLVGHPVPFLLLGHHKLAEQVLEPALAFGQPRSALGDPFVEGFVETPDLFLAPLALGDVASDAEHEASATTIRAILPYSGQLQRLGGVHVGPVARLDVAGDARPVPLL